MLLALTAPAPASAARLKAPVVGMAPTATGQGYWAVAGDGGVFSYGDAKFSGSMGGKALAAPIVGMAATPSGGGYWLVSADGGVFSFGDAKFNGSMGGKALAAPIVGMAATPSGGGYWLVSADGGVFSFGDAKFSGSMGGKALAARVVGMAATPSGSGYWLVGADGGVFSFGDAKFSGSMGGKRLAAPMVGMSATPSGGGYWLVGADGGVFSFGDAKFSGSMGGKRLAAPMAGMTPTPNGGGYWLVSADGGIFSFGAAPFRGSPSQAFEPALVERPVAPTAPAGGAGGPCPSTPGAGTPVTRWYPVVVCVLGMLGEPVTSANVNNVFIIISHESGGNPRAINTTDINARRGDPSRGLMQTIGATFAGNRSPALPNDIYDPAANIYAGLKYGKRRYGFIANIPGVRSVNAGGRYRPYRSLANAGTLLKCGQAAAGRARLTVTAHAITCRDARAAARSFARSRRSTRQAARVAPGDSGTFRLRVRRASYGCQLRRFTRAESERLNGVRSTVTCRSGRRYLAWSSGAEPRRG